MDLSIDGMLVRSDVEVAPGEDVVITFQATPLGLWFDAEGTVTRIVKGRRPGDDGRAVGLRFRNMSYLSRLLLRGQDQPQLIEELLVEGLAAFLPFLALDEHLLDARPIAEHLGLPRETLEAQML